VWQGDLPVAVAEPLAADGPAHPGQQAPESVDEQRWAAGLPGGSATAATGRPEVFVDTEDRQDPRVEDGATEQVAAEAGMRAPAMWGSVAELESPSEGPPHTEQTTAVGPELGNEERAGTEVEVLPPEGVVFTPRDARDGPEKPEAGLDSRLKTFLDQSERTPAGRAFYEPHDYTMRAAAQAVPLDPGRYTVDMHGDPYFVYVGSEEIAPNELADLLRPIRIGTVSPSG
jgi:hypothetical protein